MLCIIIFFFFLFVPPLPSQRVANYRSNRTLPERKRPFPTTPKLAGLFLFEIAVVLFPSSEQKRLPDGQWRCASSAVPMFRPYKNRTERNQRVRRASIRRRSSLAGSFCTREESPGVK